VTTLLREHLKILLAESQEQARMLDEITNLLDNLKEHLPLDFLRKQQISLI
jgi:hypothetical protein